MKKLYSTLFLAALTLAAGAQTTREYTDNITVNINGEKAVSPTTISVVDKGDGSYDLTVNNFMLVSGEDVIPVGNIALKDIHGNADGNIVVLTDNETIQLEPGNAEGIDFWMGTILPPVPINMVAEMRGTDRLDLAISIDLTEMLGQFITVTFGNGINQLPNGNFEAFKEQTNSGKTGYEPVGWHSFLTHTGSLAGFCTAIHTEESSDVRPGTTGTKSVKVFATSVLGIITANGTMTTGRLNAGSMTASDAANHAFFDTTENDPNGDPFYAIMNGRPDALSLWVKPVFADATINSEFATGTVNAVITSTCNYEDPSNSTWDNIVAQAQDTQVSPNGDSFTTETIDGWQHLVIPFTYTDLADAGKYILMTVSTNAVGGKGKADDAIYVDDVELIYNHGIKSVKYDGVETIGSMDENGALTAAAETIDPAKLDITTDAAGAQVIVKPVDETNAMIYVLGGNKAEASCYTIKADPTFTGGITHAIQNATYLGTYNLKGERVSTLQRGQVYVVKYSDGTIKKILNK